MGASSSGLLDEAKVANIKGLVDGVFQRFSVLYRQQYSAAYFEHLHHEVDPKKDGRGLLLTQAPMDGPEEVLYQGCVKFSCWYEQGKKCRERYIVLTRDYKVAIHENKETFSRGCAAKLVLHPAGGSVFTTAEESRAHLEHTCAAVLSEVKEDSSSMALPPDVFAVHLHLPYIGHSRFLFQQEEERDHFLSALKSCIRHCNLDPWCDSSHETQAYIRALRLYRQDKGCYESWEMLLGTQENVLASLVMEEILPWLQLQSRVKGKKTERIRQWLTTVQATYTLVLEQLTPSLQALREECCQTALASQAVIRPDLDQIMSSRCFLEEKVRACICEEAATVCSESIDPYMSSILEALTEKISAGIQGMQHTLHTQMDSAFIHTNGDTGDTKKFQALSTLSSIRLDQCYLQVETLKQKLEGLKQCFGLNNTQRLVHTANLDMEKLLNSAVYTLKLFLQSSARLPPSQIPDKLEKAKERVLKQLDYDSRVIQKRFYQEALLEITLPALTRRMDSKWKDKLRQFEQYIFSGYSSFILVHNVYSDVLRNILSKEIEIVVQDAVSKRSNNLLLDTPDLTLSQYSLLGQTPHSAPGSPALHARDASSAAPSKEPDAVVEERGQTVSKLNTDAQSDPSTSQTPEQSSVILSPVIVVTQQSDQSSTEEDSSFEETQEVVTHTPLTTAAPSTSPDPDSRREVSTVNAPANPQTTPDISTLTLSSSQSSDAFVECDQSAVPKESTSTPDVSLSGHVTEDAASAQHPCSSSSSPPVAESPVKISLGLLCKAISSTEASVVQAKALQPTDRAVYLTGAMKNNWETDRLKEEKQKGVGERDEEKEETELKGEWEAVNPSTKPADPLNLQQTAPSSGSENEEQVDTEGAGSEPETDKGQQDEDQAEEKGVNAEQERKEETDLRSPQPECAAALPLDSVSAIRELVTEVTEVETVISPCLSSSHTA